MNIPVEQRISKRCPNCGSKEIYFKPRVDKKVMYECTQCDFEYPAKREEDIKEFNALAKAFE